MTKPKVRKPRESAAFVLVCAGGLQALIGAEHEIIWITIIGALMLLSGLGMIGLSLLEQETGDETSAELG